MKIGGIYGTTQQPTFGEYNYARVEVDDFSTISNVFEVECYVGFSTGLGSDGFANTQNFGIAPITAEDGTTTINPADSFEECIRACSNQNIRVQLSCVHVTWVVGDAAPCTYRDGTIVDNGNAQGYDHDPYFERPNERRSAKLLSTSYPAPVDTITFVPADPAFSTEDSGPSLTSLRANKTMAFVQKTDGTLFGAKFETYVEHGPIIQSTSSFYQYNPVPPSGLPTDLNLDATWTSPADCLRYCVYVNTQAATSNQCRYYLYDNLSSSASSGCTIGQNTVPGNIYEQYEPTANWYGGRWLDTVRYTQDTGDRGPNNVDYVSGYKKRAVEDDASSGAGVSDTATAEPVVRRKRVRRGNVQYDGKKQL